MLVYNGTHWVNLPQSAIVPDLSQLENHLSNLNNPHQVQFSQLLNKPTTLSGYGITDAAALNHNHAGVYEPAFTKNTAFNKNFGTSAGTVSEGNHKHTFASLTSKPTTLAGYGITDAASSSHTHTFASITSKPTTLSGYGITDAVTINTTQTITGTKTFSAALTASVSVTTPKVTFAAAGWSLEQSGTELHFKYNGTTKQRMLSDGSIVATGELTAYVAAT